MTDTKAVEKGGKSIFILRYSKVELNLCIALSLLACLIWITFSLPIILFHVYAQEQEAVHTTIDDLIQVKKFNVTLNCSKGFTVNPSTGYCIPVCGEWSEFSQNTTLFFRIIRATFCAIHTLGTIAAFGLSCYNYKIMFKFPSVLLVYYLLMHIFVDILYAITSIGQNSILCASFDLLQTIEFSIPFCSFLGAVIIFSYTMRSYWWFSHTIAVFWSVWFPVHTRKIRRTKYIKFIHVIIIVIVLTLPMIPVGVLFGTGGYVLSSYTVSLSTCIPRNLTTALYVFILPICIVIPAGITFNLLTVWKLLKIRLHPSQGRNFTAEFKLLWFLFYFSIAIICGLALIGARFGKSQQNQQLYFDYFFCEMFGIDPDNPCVLEVDGYRDQSLRIATSAMFTFTPYIILIYILPVERLMWKLKLTMKKLID